MGGDFFHFQALRRSVDSSDSRLESLERELNGRLNRLERAVADQGAAIARGRRGWAEGEDASPKTRSRSHRAHDTLGNKSA